MLADSACICMTILHNVNEHWTYMNYSSSSAFKNKEKWENRGNDKLKIDTVSLTSEIECAIMESQT